MMTSTTLAMFPQLFVHSYPARFYEYPQDRFVRACDEDRRRRKDPR